MITKEQLDKIEDFLYDELDSCRERQKDRQTKEMIRNRERYEELLNKKQQQNNSRSK
jgi:hypothetical protein